MSQAMMAAKAAATEMFALRSSCAAMSVAAGSRYDASVSLT